MAYVGFVLVSAVAGSEQQVYKSLEGMREIRELYLMNGEFDIMAKVKADNPQKISEFTTKKVRALPNVRTAHTLIGPDFWMK